MQIDAVQPTNFPLMGETENKNILFPTRRLATNPVRSANNSQLPERAEQSILCGAHRVFAPPKALITNRLHFVVAQNLHHIYQRCHALQVYYGGTQQSFGPIGTWLVANET